MRVDYLTEAVSVGVMRYTLELQGCRAILERAVDDIAVAGDPADVGAAPENLARAIVEAVMNGAGGPDAVAADGVEHALGLAGRTRGVEDEERIFSVRRLARAVGVDVRRPPLVPTVPALDREGVG